MVHISVLPELTWSLTLRNLVYQLSADLVWWASVPLNILGHVALFKMVVLSWLLYALQNYHLTISTSWFLLLMAKIRSFLWARRLSHMAFAKCMRSPYDGGMGIADIRLY